MPDWPAPAQSDVRSAGSIGRALAMPRGSSVAGVSCADVD